MPFTLKTISCRNISIRDYESIGATHDLKINVDHRDLYSNDFMLYLEDYLMYKHHRGFWVSMTGHLTSK